MAGTPPAVYVVYLVLASALVVATFVDLKLRIIPNEITITGVLLAPFVSIAVPALQNGPFFLARVLPAGAVPPQVVGRAAAFLAGVLHTGGGRIHIYSRGVRQAFI